jgi:hypothetical protein
MAESILYEALDSCKSVFSPSGESQYKDLAVRFQVIAFAPLPLDNPLIPPIGVANLTDKLKKHDILSTYHVTHEMDHFTRCLSLLHFAERRGIDRPEVEQLYRELELTLYNGEPYNYASLERRVVGILVQRSSGAYGVVSRQNQDTISRMVQDLDSQPTFATHRVTMSAAAVLGPVQAILIESTLVYSSREM